MTLNDLEEAAIGWASVARCLNCSESKVRKMKKELIEAGVVFETRRGRPPQRRIAFFPSVLRRWTGVKARKGERV
jgi:predicted transcriptional regulator